MLRDIYLSAGSVGTFFITIGMFLTFIGWWMALTETVTRKGLTTGWRTVLVLLMSLFPPIGILIAAFYVRSDRREVSRALETGLAAGAHEDASLHLSMRPAAGKAA